MAASPTPRPTPASPGPNPALPPLAALGLQFPVAVAFSGGADSTCLLHAAVQVWPGQLSAIHIHHGLQPAADGFVRHCETVCAALGVPLQVVRVQAAHRSGESPEDAARKARYGALAEAALAMRVQHVLLAQHADDQVETVLLALSRGAGLPGLAAMAPRFERHGMRFERPLLGVPAEALRDWLTASGTPWIEDATNDDIAFTRNRIRALVLPALRQAFPQYREAFARSARHAAQAQALLAGLAGDDLAAMGGAPVLAALQRLPRERQANLLRHWLRSGHGVTASAAQLEELLDQVAACTTRGHRIRLRVAEGRVERVDGRLAYSPSV